MVTDLPSEPYHPTNQTHELWQLDAEGNKEVQNIGALSVINIKDVHSKTYVLSYPLQLKSKYNHPTRKDYQHCLRLAFMDFGRCKRLQLDHESVFYENTKTSPYPTQLHLWLIGLGIPVCYTPKGNPQQQGTVERSHQTMDRQVFWGQTYNNWEQVLNKCWQRRKRLNESIPCRMLEDKPPFEAFPEARHSGLKYSPAKEEKLFSQERIFEYLARGEWYRKTNYKQIHLGGKKYRLPNAGSIKEVKIKFNRVDQCFEFYNTNNEFIESAAPKGLSFGDLCGDIDFFNLWYKKHKHLLKK